MKACCSVFFYPQLLPQQELCWEALSSSSLIPKPFPCSEDAGFTPTVHSSDINQDPEGSSRRGALGSQ